ncbi:phosphopantetheine-binding protein [Gordonia sputi]
MSTEVRYTDIARLLNENFPDFAGVVDEGSTFSDLDLDSLVLVELAVVVSKEYGIDVSEEDVVTAQAFAPLAALVTERLGNKAAVTGVAVE